MISERNAPIGFPIDAVRNEFPALSIDDAGLKRAYLDSPAGTQVPGRVAEAAVHALLAKNANVGGLFRTSLSSSEVVERARAAMALFLGASSSKGIVIGPNMTSLAFQISRSLARTFRAGDEIVVTRMDHDANVAPWLAIARDSELTIRWLPFDSDSWRIEAKALDDVLTDRTKLVAFTYASNLTGSVNDITALMQRVRQSGALSFVDAVQYAPHGLIDVTDLGCDFLAVSSYKFFGPHLGVLWGRESVLESLEAYKVRPSKNVLPMRFETGTPQIELLAALEATIGYFEWLGKGNGGASRRTRLASAFAMTSAWESMLAKRLLEGLLQVKGLRIVGRTDPNEGPSRLPIVSFLSDTYASRDIAQALARENIFIWSGSSYALETVRTLGIDEVDGVVRIGAAHYNTIDEIDRVVEHVARLHR